MRKNLYILIFISFNTFLFSQEYKSIHQVEAEYYGNHPELIGKEVIAKTLDHTEFNKITSISHKIYGFHPYWASDATAAAYYYSLLTHIAYFSAEVDTSVTTTGGFATTRSWSTTQVVNYCKNNGVKIHLAITMFAKHDRVLTNASYRTNLINNILTQVKLRSADGANIDFESVPSSQKTNFRTFIKQLGDSLKANNLELVVELPAVDWSGIYDNTFFITVNSVVDYYFLMAYDYYYRGSTTAGPISPLTTGTSIRHVTRSIDAYYSVGAAPSKLITGFNYYGYEWPVVSNARMASTTGQGVTKTFSQAKAASSSIPAEDKFFDATYSSPWYRYLNGSQWYQTWYDDSLSMAKKYDSIKSKGCAGTGMWALSYDGSNTDLWGALKNAFASTSNIANTMLADFEASAGTFYNSPTFSGSTIGISTSSTAARVTEQAFNGWSSLKVVLLDNSSSDTNWTVRLLSGGGSPTNNQALISSGYIGFWLKSSSVPSGAQVAITVDDVAGGTELSPKRTVTNSGEWTLYEWNLQESGWSNFSLGNGVVNGPTATLDAIMFYAPNNSLDWTIYIDDVSYNSSSPLPVELISFYAVVNRKSVNLHWQTASEKNNYGFEVERAEVTVGQSGVFTTVGFVKGSGNSNAPKEYSFVDNGVSSGKYLYRLKQIDNDGKSEYSSTIEVDLGLPTEYSLLQNYPNPFNPETVISWQSAVGGHISLKVYDVLGREVATLINEVREAGRYSVEFNAAHLASGTYMYRLIAGDFVQTKKMVLLK